MSLAILGIGTAVPATRVTQAEAVAAAQVICSRTAQQAALLPVFYRLTGIDTRHLAFPPQVVQDALHGTAASQSAFLPRRTDDDRGPTTRQRMQHYAQEAGPLAALAARRALDDAGLAPRRLTHLVTVSCTGFHAPGPDRELIARLDLPPTVERTHVGFMGCHGAFNGLRVALAFAGADPAARVLVCAVELCSLHYHYGWDPEKMVANALFADGAAAVVGGAAPAAAPDPWLLAATGSCLFPDSAAAMTWSIGDHGFEMTLSPRIPDLLAAHLRPWLEEWLAAHGLAPAAVASWAIHPGGPRILAAIEKALGLSREATAASRAVLAECGNMSSPTVLFILQRLRQRQALRPCVALGFGPGLVAEALLFR
jgi:predicted naringenin-chalcone synthase